MGLREAYHLPILILSPNTFRKKLMFTSDMCIISVDCWATHLRLFACFLFTFAWITRNIWTKPETRRLNLTDSFSLFFAVSSAFILTSLAYYEPVLSTVHPRTCTGSTFIDRTYRCHTLYIITRPHLQPNKCCCHILCQRHIDDPIFSPTVSFPFSIFPLFLFSKHALTAKEYRRLQNPVFTPFIERFFFFLIVSHLCIPLLLLLFSLICLFLDPVSLHTLYQSLYHMFSLDIRASYLLRVINLAEFSVGTSLLLLFLLVVMFRRW